MAKSPIYVFDCKITDEYGKRASTREIAITASATKSLADLAYAILVAYDLDGNELFEFRENISLPENPNIINLSDYQEGAGLQMVYYLPNPASAYYEESLDFSLTVYEAKLAKVFKPSDIDKRLSFLYYDSSAAWQFSVSLKEVLNDDKLDRREYPKLLAGKGINLMEMAGDYASWYEEVYGDKSFKFNLDVAKEGFADEVKWMKKLYEEPAKYRLDLENDFENKFSMMEEMFSQTDEELIRNLLADKEIRAKVRKILAEYED